MKIEISNINKVEHASVLLNGLTVIAGENDTGKSTISKMIFSNIKAHSNITDYNKTAVSEKIQPHVSVMFKRLRSARYKHNGLNRNPIFLEVRKFIEELCSLPKNEVRPYLQNFYEGLEDDERLSLKMLIKRDLENIEACLLNCNNPAALLSGEVYRFVESEFLGRITSVGVDESSCSIIDEARIDPETNQKEIFMSYKIFHDNVGDLTFEDSDGFFRDVTYIESPLYLHLQEVLRRTNVFVKAESGPFTAPMVPMHIRDFSDKMSLFRASYQTEDLFRQNPDVLSSVHNITGGSFVYDSDEHRIYFTRDKSRFSLNNVASGVKSFGVLEILLQTGMIDFDKMLIWDEPENHLHPAWQVQFANILVQLVKSGIPVVVCSHSPYFIQAIRHFSHIHEIQRSVNYYLGEIGGNGLAHFDEVSDDLNRLFIKLAKPMNDIMDVV